MFSFLRAQLNRHCFLFEHVYARTGKDHSLNEFIMMVIALRGLRFCYLAAESMLYKDEWQERRPLRGTALAGGCQRSTELLCEHCLSVTLTSSPAMCSSMQSTGGGAGSTRPSWFAIRHCRRSC
jgi:hypothetical protein